MQILGTRRSKVSASRAKDQAALGTWQHQKAVLGARGGDHLYLPPGRLVRFLGCADYTTRLARALRAPQSVATPTRSGASNLDAIINEGTLTIAWVGPALFIILFAAFAWATGVFQWLWSLATWLFSGGWRGGGEV